MGVLMVFVMPSDKSRDCHGGSGFPVPRPGSIFPGRLVHELHGDCNWIPECDGIVRIVCNLCWGCCGLNCCWMYCHIRGDD